jgi:uncharacterized protein DUF4279
MPSAEDLDRMPSFGGDHPDGKYVTFRLMGADLDPDKVTRATGLTPDREHRRGDPKPSGSPYREGQWSICSSPPLPKTGNGLVDHLRWLIERLGPHAPALRRICEEDELHADFFCGYFMGQANSGFAIDPATLESIAALGADLGIDVYSEQVETELAHRAGDAGLPR